MIRRSFFSHHFLYLALSAIRFRFCKSSLYLAPWVVSLGVQVWRNELPFLFVSIHSGYILVGRCSPWFFPIWVFHIENLGVHVLDVCWSSIIYVLHLIFVLDWFTPPLSLTLGSRCELVMSSILKESICIKVFIR